MMDWFLYDNGLRHERVKRQSHKMVKHYDWNYVYIMIEIHPRSFSLV